MKHAAALFAFCLFAASCGGPEYAPPPSDKAQLVVKLKAAPKSGLPDRSGGLSDPYASTSDKPGLGKQFARVDYDDLADIAVMITGTGLDENGPAPRTARVEINSDGADHRLVLMAPGGRTALTLANRGDQTLTLFAVGDKDGFDLALAPGKEGTVSLKEPGTYELACDENPRLAVTILVAPTTWAQLGESGEEVFFDRIPPGSFEIAIQAPRLPAWKRPFAAVAGKRDTVEAEISVNTMPHAK